MSACSARFDERRSHYDLARSGLDLDRTRMRGIVSIGRTSKNASVQKDSPGTPVRTATQHFYTPLGTLEQKQSDYAPLDLLGIQPVAKDTLVDHCRSLRHCVVEDHYAHEEWPGRGIARFLWDFGGAYCRRSPSV